MAQVSPEGPGCNQVMHIAKIHQWSFFVPFNLIWIFIFETSKQIKKSSEIGEVENLRCFYVLIKTPFLKIK